MYCRYIKMRSFVLCSRKDIPGFSKDNDAFIAVIVLAFRFCQTTVQVPVGGDFSIYVTDDHDRYGAPRDPLDMLLPYLVLKRSFDNDGNII